MRIRVWNRNSLRLGVRDSISNSSLTRGTRIILAYSPLTASKLTVIAKVVVLATLFFDSYRSQLL